MKLKPLTKQKNNSKKSAKRLIFFVAVYEEKTTQNDAEKNRKNVCFLRENVADLIYEICKKIAYYCGF